MRDIAQHCGDDANKRVGDNRRYGQVNKCLDEEIGHQDKRCRGKRIPEELNTPVQVRLRENHVARQRETSRKADAKGDDICAHTRCDIKITENMNVVFMQYYVVGKIVDQYIQHGIGTAARQVSECLERQYPREGFIKKVDDSYNDISNKIEQRLLLAANVPIFSDISHRST